LVRGVRHLFDRRTLRHGVESEDIELIAWIEAKRGRLQSVRRLEAEQCQAILIDRGVVVELDVERAILA
jgi:hypothetical protein